MGEFVRVAAVADLPPGSVTEVHVAGLAIALFNVDGQFRALGNRCSHRGGPLGQGVLDGDKVICPWHAWAYDTRSGESDVNPQFKVACYAVKVESGEVLVEVELPAPAGPAG